MTKHQDLCLQRRSRPEQSDQRKPNQAANISHQPRASPDSTSLASRIEFPTMTGIGARHLADSGLRLEYKTGQPVFRNFCSGLFLQDSTLHLTKVRTRVRAKHNWLRCQLDAKEELMARNPIIRVLASIQVELCCGFRCQLSAFANRNRVIIFYFKDDIRFQDRSRLAHDATV